MVATLTLLPWLTLLTIVALLAPLSLGGWSFSTEAMKFKGERINPIAGLKRLFAMRGLVELLKALAKFALVGTIAVLVLNWLADEFIGLGRQSDPAGAQPLRLVDGDCLRAVQRRPDPDRRRRRALSDLGSRQEAAHDPSGGQG